MSTSKGLSLSLLAAWAIAAPGIRGESFHASRSYPTDRSFHADRAILGAVGSAGVAAYSGGHSTFEARALDGDRAHLGAARPTATVYPPATYRPAGSVPADAPRLGEDRSFHGDRAFHADRSFRGGQLTRPATYRYPPLNEW
jgi:hypothetical protein